MATKDTKEEKKNGRKGEREKGRKGER